MLFHEGYNDHIATHQLAPGRKAGMTETRQISDTPLSDSLSRIIGLVSPGGSTTLACQFTGRVRGRPWTAPATLGSAVSRHGCIRSCTGKGSRAAGTSLRLI